MAFHYNNTETKIQGVGKKIVRKVCIKNGKGFKSVTRYRGGSKTTSKKSIDDNDIESIKHGKFIPGLFMDCINLKKKKTLKNRA